VDIYFIIEASHLFRAGDKFKTQFFVLDVVNFLRRIYFPGEAKTIVLHGSTKEEQANRYAQALERHGVKVIKMNPIPSKSGNSKVFYKPTYYIHNLLGSEIPLGSTVVLIGFHNTRYLGFLEKYHKLFHIHIAAFSTPSKRQGVMKIPAGFTPFVGQAIDLDPHAPAIKEEFRRSRSNKGKSDPVSP
jgi:hypothetical protein